MNHERAKFENSGVVFIFLSTFLWGLFPVLVHYGVKDIAPLTFAGISILLASLGSLVYAFLQKRMHEIKRRESYFALLMITVCIVIVPYILFFIGAKMTSGINTSMLLLSEIIFTLLFTPFIGEKTTILKVLGAGGVFVGAFFIMFKGSLSFNFGDVLIIVSTLLLPVGNFYSKKALNFISPSVILFVRSFVGGLFILGLGLFFEPEASLSSVISEHWLLISVNGLLLLGLSKILWYESLKRVDISKAISLVMTFPLFSLLILVFFFGEKVSMYQWIGIAIMMFGVYFSVKRKSVDPNITKYASL